MRHLFSFTLVLLFTFTFCACKHEEPTPKGTATIIFYTHRELVGERLGVNQAGSQIYQYLYCAYPKGQTPPCNPTVAEANCGTSTNVPKVIILKAENLTGPVNYKYGMSNGRGYSEGFVRVEPGGCYSIELFI